jgi:RNA-directed DNA polymerase
MWRVRHDRIGDQVREINAALRGHYAYYRVAGNIRALFRMYRVTERYWHRMLCSGSWAASRMTWDTFNQIKERTPLLRSKLRLPHRELQARAVL